MNEYKVVSIQTGPIFDYNSDGLWENVYNETRYSIYVPSLFFLEIL